MLTVVLVVAVIFVFLRSVSATLIPAATIPLALLGTAALMYVVDFSLDNLSLMALTIAIGFVVDDAIVVLENIYRHIEGGMAPLEAALKGSQEVGFTVISISVSLIAVFIPLLFMGGIIGRFFREFALTVTFTIAISVVVCLTVIPMLCSRFLKARHEQHRGGLLNFFERAFSAMQRLYERALRVVLRHQLVTLLVFIVTAATTVVLYVLIPKGFFPQQDTGFIQGVAVTAQDSSFAATSRRTLAVADVVRADPDVYSVALNLGSTTYNTANLSITLKLIDRAKGNCRPIISALRPQLLRSEGAESICNLLRVTVRPC